jgi:hypothetical protein
MGQMPPWGEYFFGYDATSAAVARIVFSVAFAMSDVGILD